MRLMCSAQDITATMLQRCPELAVALESAQAAVKWSKRQIAPHEAAVLYCLARQADGGRILEIGTAYGYSAAVMALAAPTAQIVTLNPKAGEYEQAVAALAVWPYVRVERAWSADYLGAYRGPKLDLVFVDGSHVFEDVVLDCNWWHNVKPGGLMLFHDYSPEGSGRPTPGAYAAIRQFTWELKRLPDVLITDERGVGMAGFHKREGD